MARLPYPGRDSMPAQLAELLGSMPRNNITEMFAHATSLTIPFLRLAQAQFTALELSVRQRELVILAVAGSSTASTSTRSTYLSRPRRGYLRPSASESGAATSLRPTTRQNKRCWPSWEQWSRHRESPMRCSSEPAGSCLRVRSSRSCN